MATMYLLRHGATAPNLEKPYRLQGQGVDESLAPLGLEQALRARDALADLPFRAVYSSPLRRAMETARIVAGALGLAVQTIDGLREADVGRWEGRSWDDIRANDRAAYEAFMADPGAHGYPEGESFADVADRVTPILNGLLRDHAGAHIVVVGHQVVNRSYLARLLGLPMKLARRIKLANGGISVVALENGEPAVQTMNAALHLAGLPTAG
jgi:broad specificity phosphatase PhoE